mgnify:CR=1 FL=1
MSEGGGGGKPLHNAAEVQQTGKRSFSGVWLKLPICWRFSTRRHASVDKPDTPRTSSQYDTFLWQIDALPPSCRSWLRCHAASSRLCPPPRRLSWRTPSLTSSEKLTELFSRNGPGNLPAEHFAPPCRSTMSRGGEGVSLGVSDTLAPGLFRYHRPVFGSPS